MVKDTKFYDILGVCAALWYEQNKVMLITYRWPQTLQKHS